MVQRGFPISLNPLESFLMCLSLRLAENFPLPAASRGQLPVSRVRSLLTLASHRLGENFLLPAVSGQPSPAAQRPQIPAMLGAFPLLQVIWQLFWVLEVHQPCCGAADRLRRA